MKPSSFRFQVSGFLLVVLLAGCATNTQDNSARLIARPDFKSAVQAAPEWVRDSLRTITRLEAEAAGK